MKTDPKTLRAPASAAAVTSKPGGGKPFTRTRPQTKEELWHEISGEPLAPHADTSGHGSAGSQSCGDEQASTETANLQTCEPAAVGAQAGDKLPPAIDNSPLAAFSLLGSAAEFEQLATKALPLLGEVCLTGETTIWYAPPNAGKTLIALNLLDNAIREGRINPANAYYINADDSSAGFANKMRLMDDLGVHTISPGYKGFKAENLISLLHEIAQADKARNILILIDTVKKFTSLMDKGKSSTFANACRQVSMHGGSVLALAHTTKSPNANGKLRYAGTTDMKDDFDAAYILTPIDTDGGTSEKTVIFDCEKNRGDNAERVGYAYAAERGISYEERLASVRLVDPEHLDAFQRIEDERSDVDVIAVVVSCINDGITTKMALGKEVAARAKVSERAAIRLIETYTGTDPQQHHWTYSIKERGAKDFALLPKPVAEPPPD